MSNAAAVMTAANEATPEEQVSLAVRGLEPESAMTLRATFESMFAQTEEWAARAQSIKVTSVDQKREMKLARESRLALREIRVNAEHARKRLKEDSTRRGKAIDGIANVLKALIEPIEAHLLELETFADRADAARKTALKSAREETLRALGTDPAIYVNLGETSEGTWATTLDAARTNHEAKLEAAREAESIRVEAERIAAEKRAADRAERVKAEAERVERERLQAEENARLLKEKTELEEVAKVEREIAAAGIAEAREAHRVAQAEALAAKEAAEEATKEREAADRAVRDALEAQAKQAREEADRTARELAESKATAARVLREREEAETTRLAVEVEARRAAELAPDREKLVTFAGVLRALAIPTLSTDEGKAAAAKVAEQIERMAAWVDTTAAKI
jgi:hypothetical protein